MVIYSFCVPIPCPTSSSKIGTTQLFAWLPLVMAKTAHILCCMNVCFITNMSHSNDNNKLKQSDYVETYTYMNVYYELQNYGIILLFLALSLYFYAVEKNTGFDTPNIPKIFVIFYHTIWPVILLMNTLNKHPSLKVIFNVLHFYITFYVCTMMFSDFFVSIPLRYALLNLYRLLTFMFSLK